MTNNNRKSERYSELKLLERAGKIKDLGRQPKFPIEVYGKKICIYIADFTYWDKEKKCGVVENVNGAKTALYSLKKKLFEALYPFEITEVR